MSKFLFYGCWNNIDCEKEFIHRDAVIEYIRKYEKQIEKIFLAGDNWYSSKIKDKAKDKDKAKLQYYLTSILMTGYDKLYNLKKELHIAVGNHDEADDEDTSEEDSRAKHLKHRCMIKTQRKYIDELNDKSKSQAKAKSDTLDDDDYITTNSLFTESDRDKFKQVTLEELNGQDLGAQEFSLEDLKKFKSLSDGSKMNIYIDDIGIVEETEYVVIIINTNKIHDEKYLETVKAKFEAQRLKQKSSNSKSKKIFVMGHIPIIGIKDDNIKKKSKITKEFIDLFELIADNNFIYLCADCHYFSIMEITHNNKKIIQITVGTGGADPDINEEHILTPKYLQLSRENKDKYDIQISYYLINSYGFSIIYIYSNHITIKYKKLYNGLNQEIESPAASAKDSSANTGDGIASLSVVDTSSTSYSYKITDNFDVSFFLLKTITCDLSKLKDTFKDDKITTCELIENQKKNIEKNVVTSEDEKIFCYKKSKKKDD
jgi:hypothetical protein